MLIYFQKILLSLLNISLNVIKNISKLCNMKEFFLNNREHLDKAWHEIRISIKPIQDTFMENN